MMKPASFLLAGLCATTAPAHAQTLKVEWADHQLTVVAVDVPLAEVLAEVGRRTDSSIFGLDGVAGSITIDIRNATLLDALRMLLRGINYLIAHTYATNPAPGDPQLKIWLHHGSQQIADQKAEVTAAAASSLTVPTPETENVRLTTDDSELTARLKGDPELSKLAAQGNFNADARESTLLTLARSSNPNVRQEALRMLVVQNSKAAPAQLGAALQDENVFVRNQALELLLNLGSPDATRMLNDLARHDNPAVRLPVVMELGERGGVDGVHQLKQALEDDDAAVRGIASQLLREREKDTRQPAGGAVR